MVKKKHSKKMRGLFLLRKKDKIPSTTNTTSSFPSREAEAEMYVKEFPSFVGYRERERGMRAGAMDQNERDPRRGVSKGGNVGLQEYICTPLLHTLLIECGK